MARNLYPGSFAQFSTGLPAANTPFTVWTDLQGGTNVTGQLVGTDGTSAYIPVTTGSGSVLPFRGPDGYGGYLYVDTGSEVRYQLESPTAWNDLVAQVAAQAGGGGGTGGGVTDHGALSGLADDDHPQYLNVARGDARYYTQAQTTTQITAANATASAADRNRANHSGTQLASSISDFATAVAAAGGGGGAGSIKGSYATGATPPTDAQALSAYGEGGYFTVDDPTVVTGTTKADVDAAIAAVPEGGTVEFPPGVYDWTGDVLVTKVRVTFTGEGIIRGSFKVGSGSARLELGVQFVGLRFRRALNLTTYPVKGYADASYFIKVDRARDVQVDHCDFYGAAWPVYVMPNATAVSHDNSMIRVTDCHFNECDWAFYSTFDAASEWQALADSDFTGNIVNRSYVGMYYAQGQDGGHISGNTHFMINYGSSTNARFAEKTNNVRVDWSDWLHVTDNNLFECGLESILLTNARTYNIVGNNIAWPGQRVMSNAIDVTAGTGEYAQAVVSGNNIQYYSKSAVRLAGNHGEVQLGPNPIRYSATSDKYVGTPALSTAAHYRYDLSGVTGLVAADMTVADGVIAKTGHYDSYPNHAYLHSVRRLNAWGATGGGFRGPMTVTAGTPITVLAVKDVADATTTFQGEVQIVVKFGSSSTAKTSIYKLLVSKTPASATDCVVMSNLGYLTGSAADDPAFAWTLSGSSTLVASPVGSTAGAFTFSFTFNGNLVVG